MNPYASPPLPSDPGRQFSWSNVVVGEFMFWLGVLAGAALMLWSSP